MESYYVVYVIDFEKADILGEQKKMTSTEFFTRVDDTTEELEQQTKFWIGDKEVEGGFVRYFANPKVGLVAKLVIINVAKVKQEVAEKIINSEAKEVFEAYNTSRDEFMKKKREEIFKERKMKKDLDN